MKINYYEKRLNKDNIDTIDGTTTNNHCNDSTNNNNGSSIHNYSNDTSNDNHNQSNDTYSDKKMWNNVKQLTNKLKQTPPRMITHNNKVITSLNKITNIANNHYKNKVEKIRNTFTNNHNIDPIQLLHNLIPKPDTTFKLLLPSLNDVAEIIKKATSTYSVGNDIINMNIIKN